MNSLRTRIVNRRNIQSTMRQLQPLCTAAPEKTLPEIKIPMRKERGPTDILRALETTLLNDPLNSDYRFMDDPFFIPTSTKRKRLYALSKESGRRAARYILENHSDIMYSELSEPLIKAYLPPEKYTEKSQVSEEKLLEIIKKGWVNDSLHVYKLLEMDVSVETKQALLELLCFYNSEHQDLSEDFPEELRYRPPVHIKKNVWNDNPDVTSLFDELKNNEKTAAAAYSAMICGTAKYCSAKLSEELYKESVQKNLPISNVCFNYLIKLTRYMIGNEEDRKSAIENYLKDMIQREMCLDVDVLNAVLSVLESNADNIDYAISIFSKFKSFGVEPTLTTYYYLLLIFSGPGGKVDENVFIEILDEVKSKEFVLQDEMDQYFFSKAMSIASNSCFPSEVGHEIYDILLSKNKKYFLNNTQANHFFNSYILLVLSNESLSDFIQFYDKLVPSACIPDHEVMKNILENFLFFRRDNKLLPLICKFVGQTVSFEMLYNNNLLKLSLKAVVKHCTSKEEPHLQREIAEYAWKVWTHLNNLHQKLKYQVLLPVEVYKNIVILLLYASEFVKAYEVYDYLLKHPEKVVGTFKHTDLDEIFSQCCIHNLADFALLVLEYTQTTGIGNPQIYGKIIKSKFDLNENQKQLVTNILGS